MGSCKRVGWTESKIELDRWLASCMEAAHCGSATPRRLLIQYRRLMANYVYIPFEAQPEDMKLAGKWYCW
ncbi:unnamed protein product [Symbiodinium sp. CCMP2592]|nr:unnamed protein product [Symbiodinium sp. CCMP2592]